MKLSIIIPMYNAGGFIGTCLRSCMSQDLSRDEYEVIVVNDGSTDDGPAVVRGMIESNGWDNVRVVDRENGGLSTARNTGFGEASGEYIWFVDADDWIQDNCLGRLLEKVEGQDVLVLGAVDYCRHEGTMQKGDVFSYPEEVSRSGPEHLMAMSERLKMCVPFSILNRKFLLDNGLRFVPGLIHEDAEFMPRAICIAKTVHVTTMTPYCRLVRQGSLSRDYNPARVNALLEVASRLHSFTGSGKVGEEQLPSMNSIISNVLNQSFKLVKAFSVHDAGLERRFSEEFRSMGWTRKTFLKAKEFKYRLEGALISIFPKHPVKVYSLLARFR